MLGGKELPVNEGRMEPTPGRKAVRPVNPRPAPILLFIYAPALPLLPSLAAMLATARFTTTLNPPSPSPRYLSERQQFGQPLGSFQLLQEKMARMAGNIQVGACGWARREAV